MSDDVLSFRAWELVIEVLSGSSMEETCLAVVVMVAAVEDVADGNDNGGEEASLTSSWGAGSGIAHVECDTLRVIIIARIDIVVKRRTVINDARLSVRCRAMRERV